MRPLHLLGVMPPDYRFHSPDGAPLMLPGAIPGGDHEIILAFFQQVITERPLPRVEVDWYTMLLDPSRRYLEHVLGERGSSGAVLVVKVREQGVDLRQVVEHPVIRGFQHVAVSNVHPGGGEELRALLAITRDVRDRAEDLYEEAAERLALRADGWQLIADFVQTLQSPIDVLETVNALIEVQLERNAPEQHRKMILRRMLTRLLEWRSAGEFCALVGIAARGLEETMEILGSDAEAVLGGLTAQGLLRDDELRQWAAYLAKDEFGAEGLAFEGRLPTEAQRTEAWADRVQEVMRWTRPSDFMPFIAATSDDQYAIKLALIGIIPDITDGKVSRAREYLAIVERILRRKSFGPDPLWAYWYARSALEYAEGALEDAERSVRRAIDYFKIAAIKDVDIRELFGSLSKILQKQGRVEEAQAALDEAERLKPEPASST